MILKYIKLITAFCILLLGNRAIAQAEFNLDNSTQFVMNGVTQVVLSGGADLKTVTSQITIGGGILTISGVVQGTGNFIGSTTSELVLNNAGSGTLNFAAGSNALNNFTLNKSGSSVTLNSPLTINGLFNLQAGVLNTSTSNLVTLGSSAVSTGSLAYTSGQVNGPFQRWFAAAINAGSTGDFPIGNSITLYNPKIAYTTAPTAGGTLTAEWVGTIPGNTGLPLADGANLISAALPTGFWKINGGNGLSGGNYTASLAANGFSSVTDVSKLRIIKRPSGGNWIADGTAGINTGTLANPIVVRNGLSGFSEFGIAQSTVAPAASLNFNGVNNYVVLPKFDFSSGNKMTIEAWIKPSNITSNQFYEISRQQITGFNTPNWLLSFQGNGTILSFGVNTTTGYNELDVPISASNYVDGNWHHIAAVYDGATKKIYKDGVLIGTNSATGNIIYSPTAINLIGNSAEAYTEPFNGNIDEVRFWNRALPQCEILNNMNCELAAGQTNLLAYYQFNQGQDAQNNVGETTLNDISGNSLNGTLTNFVLTGTSSNWVLPGAVTTGTSCAVFVPLSATNTQTNVSCFGGNNGTATVVANGGFGGYTYSWYPSGGNAATASSLTAGFYDCTITSGGCTTTSSVTITQPVNDIPTAISPQVYAGSATLANLTANGVGLQWYANSTGGVALLGTDALVNGTTYYVSQTIGACESERASVLVRKISEATLEFCSTATVSSLVSTPNAGSIASWFANSSGGASLANGTTLSAGNYYIEQLTPQSIVAIGSGFSAPFGLAVRNNGKIIVADYNNNAMKSMNADGTGVTNLGSGFFHPVGVAIDANDRIVIADYGNNAIKRMNADGTGLITLGSGFINPTGISFQTDGKIIIADQGNNAIKRMNADGTGIITLANGFNLPTGVVVQSDGKIVFTDLNNSTLKRINADGTGLITLASGFRPYGIALQADGKIVTADLTNNSIKRMNADGTGIITLASGFNGPTGVAVQANGKILFTDNGNNAVKRISEASTSNRVAVAVTLNTPVTAAAGADKTVCSNVGNVAMTANAATPGTGVWTQTAGPITASISSTSSATTNIGGLTTAGVYKFVWTISNGACTPSTDTVDITVNTSPAAFALTSAGVFCPSTQTLSGPTDPNYSYAWERSLTGIASPNSFTTFGGIGFTQAVTASGIYKLIITNQFGCTVTDTVAISLADYVFNGSLAAGDAQQTGRMNRFAVVSTCAAPKAYPGTFTTTGARYYESYTITNNRNVPVCSTIGLTSNCGTTIFGAAYLGSFNPTSVGANYLADFGSSFPGTAFIEATIPANSTIVIVVHEVNPGTGCAGYQLNVDVPRDLAAITATPSSVNYNGTSSLAAPIADSYLWSPGGGTTQTITTAPITATTQFYATLGYGNNGCIRLDSVTVNLSCTLPVLTCPTSTTTAACQTQAAINSAFATWLATTSGSGGTNGVLTNNNTGAPSACGGSTTVTFTYTNDCPPLVSNCQATFTVTAAPTVVLSCPINTTVAACQTQAAVNTAFATWLATVSASGGCNGVLTNNNTGAPSACGGNTTVTFTYNSNCAPLSTTCQATFTVAAPPTIVISCPIATTVSCVALVPAINTAAVLINVGCSVVITHVSDVISNQTCVNKYLITRTYRAIDVCGNFVLCPQLITVNDNIAPTINCPAAITVCGIANVPAVNIASVTASDNCAGGVTVTHMGDVGSPSSTAPYNITRTYRATDLCGNFTDCTQLITVNPAATVTAVTNQVVCNNSPTTAVAFTSPTTGGTIVYNWTNNTTSIGLAATGTVNITSFNGVNTTTAPITATITVTPTFTNNSVSCVGTPRVFTITVNPTATVNTVANQTVCNGSPVTAVAFGTTTTGGTVIYNWTNNTTSIGLAATGIGNIASFNGVNTTTAPITATITVTPTFTNNSVSCIGTPRVFTITINPTATVNTVANQTVCNGSPVNAVAFGTTTTGGTVVYNWTNNTTSIGLAATGTGNITSFNGVNTTTAPITATITVTPTFTSGAVSCVGTPRVFTITVNPTATVNPISNQVLCNSFATTAINFSSPVSGGTIAYNWTNSASSIGLAASGTGNIASFAATNTTQVPVVATINVAASFTNGGVTCTGPNTQFTITVNPTPIVTLAAFAAICKNAATITLTGGLPLVTVGTTGFYTVDNVTQTVFNPANYTPGLHTIVYTYTNIYGCVRSATQTILVHPVHNVEITLAPNRALSPGTPVTAVATVSPPDNYTYNWSKNNAAIITSPTNTDRILIQANDAGNYKVVVTAPTGCVVTSASLFTESATIPTTLFVFPNPSTGLFNVSYNNGAVNLTARTLNVYDGLGQKVFTKRYDVNVPFGNMQVDLRNKAAGTYLIELLDSNGKQLGITRVIKTN